MSGTGAHDTIGRGLAAALGAAGHKPPVLVVADAQTVARLALAWLDSFDEVGWLYRVRVFSGRATAAEIGAVGLEARSLGAKTIVATGDKELIGAAEAAGRHEKIQCFAVPCPTPEGG